MEKLPTVTSLYFLAAAVKSKLEQVITGANRLLDEKKKEIIGGETPMELGVMAYVTDAIRTLTEVGRSIWHIIPRVEDWNTIDMPESTLVAIENEIEQPAKPELAFRQNISNIRDSLNLMIRELNAVKDKNSTAMEYSNYLERVVDALSRLIEPADEISIEATNRLFLNPDGTEVLSEKMFVRTVESKAIEV